jgi:nucleoside-diphosphate-sugar epimerase
MKCLITGGTGFLGRHVVQELIQAGHEVRALVRRDALSLERAGAELFSGDVLDPDSLAAACEGVEVLLHLAGKVAHGGHASEMFEVHVEGTRNVLAAAAAAKLQRVVHVSSSGTIAVSTDPEQIVDETGGWTTEVVRRWPYYLSKIYAEKLALQAHTAGKVPVVVINPSLLLGPGDSALSSSQVILSFLRREIPGIPPGGMNFVDVRDAAGAIAAAVDQGRPGERYLLGGPNMTLEAFFVLLGRVSGIEAPTIKISRRANAMAAHTLSILDAWGATDSDEEGDSAGDEGVSYSMAGHYWYLDASKAKQELGFQPRSPEHTLRDAVAWVRSRGPLPRGQQGLMGAAFRGLRRVFG